MAARDSRRSGEAYRGIIQWTDADALDLMRSRRVEQEVLDLLDED
jgi:hypothetical protein